jgi:hypothetical protein
MRDDEGLFMKHAEMNIGELFTYQKGVVWRVTDMGFRVIVAVCVGSIKDGICRPHFNPQNEIELVFNEKEIPLCTKISLKDFT